MWTLGSALAEQQRRLKTGQVTTEDLGKTLHAFGNVSTLYNRLPLVDMPVLQEVTPYYFDWLAHSSYDDYWRSTAPQEVYERVIVPALNIGGWFDIFLLGTLANYQGYCSHFTSCIFISAPECCILTVAYTLACRQ